VVVGLRRRILNFIVSGRDTPRTMDPVILSLATMHVFISKLVAEVCYFTFFFFFNTECIVADNLDLENVCILFWVLSLGTNLLASTARFSWSISPQGGHLPPPARVCTQLCAQTEGGVDPECSFVKIKIWHTQELFINHIVNPLYPGYHLGCFDCKLK
jgi:hypothetical protein